MNERPLDILINPRDKSDLGLESAVADDHGWITKGCVVTSGIRYPKIEEFPTLVKQESLEQVTPQNGYRRQRCQHYLSNRETHDLVSGLQRDTLRTTNANKRLQRSLNRGRALPLRK